MAKQTLDEKTDDFLDAVSEAGIKLSLAHKEKLIIAHRRGLVRQDRDTLHACAELIAGMNGLNLGLSGLIPSAPTMIKKDLAHNEIMNCRGGIE